MAMISVLTLNLRFGLAPDGVNGWKYRKESLTHFLKQYPADFIGFQEANDFQIEHLESILTDFGSIGRRSPAPAFWQHNMLFYRNTWRCIYRDHFFLSPTPDVPSRARDSKWPRQCTVGMFQQNSQRIICINTHFDFSPEVQARSARIILNRISSLPAGVPAVLSGDFNATPESPCYQIFTGKDSGARVFKNAFSRPYPATFHGFSGKTDGGHIDWILYAGDITPSASHAIQQKFNRRYPSDHFPLLAKFRI